MARDCIQLSVDNRNIATLSLHRPELHNAMDDTMTQRLTRELHELGRDPAIRAVVLTGSGMNFSTGHDMQWLARMNTASENTLREQAALLADLLHTLDTLPKPTIAKIHGSAFGIGVGLVACCDVAISCTDSLFGFSEVKLGSIPSSITPYVVRAIGARATRRYFITAERFNAGKAKRLGLVHQVVEADELDGSLDMALRHLLQNGPHAMSAAKQMVNDIAQLGDGPAAIQLCIDRVTAVRMGEEGREGINAYLDKRPPAWLG